MQHLEHDINVVAVILELRALVGVGDVFHHQRVQPEAAAELVEQPHVVHTRDMHPGHARAQAQTHAFLDARKLPLHHLCGIVMQQPDARAFAFLLADVHGRAGRQTGLA